ncbi:MAG: FdhF/YdeP family oxidoreductase [Myxococcota bacterium]
MSNSDGKPDAALKLVPHKGAAAGFGAISQTMKHAAREMGMWRGTKLLLQVNQQEGFDCPGCAWPDPAHRTTTEFCENGAKAVAEEAMRARVTREFFAKHSVEELQGWSDMALGKAGRLTEPMVLRGRTGHYEPITWDAAMVLIGEALAGLDSPHRAAFYTSGRTSNEAAFLYQLFAREYGTNNLPDCSNMCHESSGVGLSEVIGIGKGTVQLEDFEQAEAIFVIGQNPGTNHPRMLTSLQAASRNGAAIVAVNPLEEPALRRFKHPQEVMGLLGSGTPIATHYLKVRVGGDAALLQGIAKAVLVLEAARPGEVLDHAFIETHCVGFEDYAASIAALPWGRIVEDSGIGQAEIEAIAEVYAASKATIICWAMGLTQHRHGVMNIQECVNLLLLKGNLGKPGAGACPVRGHSNVQGDRTMGIWDRPSAGFIDRLSSVVGFEAPKAHGYNVVEALEAMLTDDVEVFVAMGGNLVGAAPDTPRTAKAVGRCRLTVHVSTKLNRSHVAPGEVSLILPCLGRTERDLQGGEPQFVTVENSMGIVHRSQGKLDPASPQLLSEPDIVARMARATLGEASVVDWETLGGSYDAIRDLVEAVIPGFDDYNARVRQPNGFMLPNGVRERQWATASGRAHFTCHTLPDLSLGPGQLVMITVRSHDQYNTTIYGLDDRYRGVLGERRVVFMHAKDMEERGIASRSRVDIQSHFQGEVREVHGFLAVPHELPRGTIATYFPEANPLVPLGSYADKSYTPTSKYVVVTVCPGRPQGASPSA